MYKRQHIHDNHLNEYNQELAKEENKKIKITESESDSDSDQDYSKLSLEERIKGYEEWVESFHKIIDKIHLTGYAPHVTS